MSHESVIPCWAKETNCAITVCDSSLNILFMNDLARKTFASHGDDLIGRNLREFHQERSLKIIDHMLSTGESNCYTIEKNGLHKIIYQTPWRNDGKIAGLVEISMIVPAELPHYVR